ncbi:carboxypeptidase regulatory-like domain-containing protein [bacterium]
MLKIKNILSSSKKLIKPILFVLTLVMCTTNVFAETYEFDLQWGSSGTSDGQFKYPNGIAIDSNGNVYVTDKDNHRVQKFTSDGTFITKWGSYGSGDGQFNKPAGIAVDASDNVYVVEQYNHRIQKFTSDGILINTWGSYGYSDGKFCYPVGIAIDRSGNIYVVDTSNSRIQKFSSDGTFITKWGSYGIDDGKFNRPKGIAVDDNGNVYVTDTDNDRVQKFLSDGTFIMKWGNTGTSDGKLDYPCGIDVDSSGNVYVSDGYNFRIQKFTSDGAFIGKWKGVSIPNDIEITENGKIYIANTYGNNVKRYTLKVQISGYVKDSFGNALSSTKVTLAGAASTEYITTSSGYYEFTDLETDNYTVTPEHTDYDFLPLNKTYLHLSNDELNQDYVGEYTLSHVISGYLKDTNGNGIFGVKVKLFGAATGEYITGSNGYYEFTDLRRANYTVTPTHDHYKFDPLSKNYTLLSSNQENQDYVGTNAYIISGYVEDTDGNAIAGSTVTLSGAASVNYVTDINGYYKFQSLEAGDYTVTSKHLDYTFTPKNYNYTQLSNDQSNQNFTGTVNVYTINGYIKDVSGNVISGSTVTLSGLASLNCLTDANGYFEFQNLLRGDYTITPNHESYRFSPQSKSYTQLFGDKIDQDFTGTYLYTISGYIKDDAGMAISGSTITLSGAASLNYLTDSSGYYEFKRLETGDYLVTPNIKGCKFNPVNKSYTQLNANQFNQNYIGTYIYKISGYIKDVNGNTIILTTVTLSGAVSKEYIVGSNGFYKFTGLEKGDYTVVPGHQDYKFNPENANYTQLSSDQENQDYTGVLSTYTVSGYLKDVADNTISGSTVTLSGAATAECVSNSNGYYEFRGLERGDYTVTPNHVKFKFNPINLSYTQLLSDKINQDFTATSVYTLSGYIKDDAGNKIAGSTVTLSGAASLEYVTDSSGYYEFRNLEKGDYVVTAEHLDYTFSPTNKNYTQLSTDQENQDFTGILITYSISGYLKDDLGNTISGSTVTLSGNSTFVYITDNNGYYEFKNLIKADYIITPKHVNYKFNPLSKSYVQLNIDQTNQDYVGIHAYSINGYIKDSNGVIVSGSTVTLSGAANVTLVTDNNGYYEFRSLTKGDYTITPSHQDYSFTPTNKTYSQLSNDQENQNFLGTVHTYSISGYVKDSNNTAIFDSTVTLSGAAALTCLTDSNGYYEFNNILRGNYVISPNHNKYAFSPVTKSYTQLVNDKVNQNFTGTVLYKISGYLTNSIGTTIAGAIVSLSGQTVVTCTTDSNGYYEFTGLARGSYTLVPYHESYVFTPQYKFYYLTADQTNQNFYGTQSTYSISGYLKNGSSNAIVGSTVTLSGAASKTCVTNANGYYTFTNLPKDDYTITCAYGNCTFMPAKRTYSQLNSDQVNQNFTAQQPIIAIDSELLEFGVIKKGNTKTLAFTITNTGNGTLEGNIKSNRSWIKLSPRSFISNTQTVEVTVDSLDRDGQYTGTITVESNGGTATIQVKIEANCVLTKPNPYNPNKHNGLKFYGSGIIPNDTTIQIFTISGEHVKTLNEEIGLKEIAWDGRNENGDRVVSGLYIYASKSPEEKWVGKFTILKK